MAWIIDVITNQKARPGNEDFKFTIEAPAGGGARNLPHFKWIEVDAAQGGGIGGVRCELHYCKFGTDYKKPTFFWTNIPSLIADLTADDSRRCTKIRPCKVGSGEHKNLGGEGGRIADAAAYPDDLVTFLASHVMKACDMRRKDKLPA